MKINQPKFKTKKPIGLTLDYLESQQPQKEILSQAQEINQFDDIFNQYQQQQHPKELDLLNQSKQSNFEHNQNDESKSSKGIYLPINEENQNQKVQKIIFEEYYPQNIDNSDYNQIQQDNLSNINTKLIQEPPAPKNKDYVKQSFPQKGSSSLTGLKKQIQIEIPEVEHNNNNNNITSSYEQTMIKQQQKQMNDLELKSQIFQLQNDKDKIKNQYQLEIIELNTLIQELQTKLEIEQAQQIQLKQQNQKLTNLISQIDNQTIEKQEREQLRCSNHNNNNNNLNDKEKIQYLIEKLNTKSTQNAKLHYEIIKLQNNVEMLETQQILHLKNNPNQIYNQDKQSINQVVPLEKEIQQTNQLYNKKENIKASVMMQQKQSILNLSANHSQLDQNKNMNFSNMITPQANKNEVSTSIHKNLTLHQTKNGYFKEDNLQQIRKIQSTKNSTSVGELNIIRQDPTNYSNILQNMMKKGAPNSPNKYIHATQKFKETLDSKLNNITDKQKSYASLLFSGGDSKKSRHKDAYYRQYSPHINEDIQFKTRQLFQLKPYSNSRKESETIKSEESHKLSTDKAKYQNKYEYSNYQKKGTFQSTLDILQMVKDINNNQKIGISVKINYKKKCDATYEQQSNLRQYKNNLY